MNKKTIIVFILFAVLSALYLIFNERIYEFISDRFMLEEIFDYKSGEATGEKGKIGLKIRVDNSGAIKEVVVTEHTDSEIAINALQKLIDSSLDKQSADEIDAVSGATDTSETYKKIISKLLDERNDAQNEESKERVSLAEPEIQLEIERKVVNGEGFKSGIGGYVFNTFKDADYNKNGDLVTNEYICAVLLNQYNRIEDVKFDHIASNISFDRVGRVPTGNAKAYTFTSDKSQVGFNGLVNDGNYININGFEKQILELRHFEDVKNRFINKRGYAPLVHALENAIDNARFIGANNGDTLGIAVSKILRKRDIKDSTDEKNGQVNFTSNYCMITVNKDNVISSCMFDNVENKVTLTNTGKILGSREKEIYTLNELANTTKYTRIEKSRYDMKLQLNVVADFMRENTIDNMLTLIKDLTDDKGRAKPDMAFKDLDRIDFIECIDLLSKSYVDAVKIKAS